MNRRLRTKRDLLEEVFASYDGISERNQIVLNIIEDVIDVLAITADSLEVVDPNTQSARNCLLRCGDRLRLALRLDEILDDETDADEPEPEKAEADEAQRVIDLIEKHGGAS